MAFVTATDFNTDRMYRKTVDELSALSGSELGDLGLTRGSIHATAHRAVYGN